MNAPTGLEACLIHPAILGFDPCRDVTRTCCDGAYLHEREGIKQTLQRVLDLRERENLTRPIVTASSLVKIQLWF